MDSPKNTKQDTDLLYENIKKESQYNDHEEKLLKGITSGSIDSRYSEEKNCKTNIMEISGCSTYLIIGNDSGKVSQYLIKNLSKEFTYPQKFQGIRIIKCSSNGKYMFIAEKLGKLVQYNIQNKTHIKDYYTEIINNKKKLVSCPEITALSITKDSSYIFIGDDRGRLLQISIKNLTIMHDYGCITDHYNTGITKMDCSKNSQLLLVGDNDGSVKQFDVHTHKLVYNYGSLFPDTVTMVYFNSVNEDKACISYKDGNFCLLATSECTITKLKFELTKLKTRIIDSFALGFGVWVLYEDGAIENYLNQDLSSITRVPLDYNSCEKFDENGFPTPSEVVTAMEYSNDGNYLFTGDICGILKQYFAENLELFKNYGQIHPSGITAISCTYHSNFLFSCDARGHLKQYNIETQKLHKDYKSITDSDLRLNCLLCTYNDVY